jgi:hypothetical protein
MCIAPALLGGLRRWEQCVLPWGNTADRQPQWTLTYCYLSQSAASQNEKWLTTTTGGWSCHHRHASVPLWPLGQVSHHYNVLRVPSQPKMLCALCLLYCISRCNLRCCAPCVYYTVSPVAALDALRSLYWYFFLYLPSQSKMLCWPCYTTLYLPPVQKCTGGSVLFLSGAADRPANLTRE